MHATPVTWLCDSCGWKGKKQMNQTKFQTHNLFSFNFCCLIISYWIDAQPTFLLPRIPILLNMNKFDNFISWQRIEDFSRNIHDDTDWLFQIEIFGISTSQLIIIEQTATTTKNAKIWNGDRFVRKKKWMFYSPPMLMAPAIVATLKCMSKISLHVSCCVNNEDLCNKIVNLHRNFGKMDIM